MAPRPTPSRATAALVTGLGTALYYATPDVLPSRTARGWAKAGLTAVAVAASAPEVRAEWANARHELVAAGDPAEAFAALPAASKAVVLGAGAAVLAGALGGLLAVERSVFRRGQARAAAGKRLAHTGPALLYGVLAGGLWLIPPPPPRATPPRVLT